MLRVAVVVTIEMASGKLIVGVSGHGGDVRYGVYRYVLVLMLMLMLVGINLCELHGRK